MAVEDIILVAVLLMVVGSGLFIVGFVGSTFSDNIVLQSSVNESSHAVAVFEAVGDTSESFDKLFLALFIGLVLSLIILSWLIPAHPIFYIGYFITMLLSVIVSALMSNVWEAMSNTSKLSTMLVHFPIMNHVLLYLPLYSAVVGFIGVTIMFGKPYLGGNK